MLSIVLTELYKVLSSAQLVNSVYFMTRNKAFKKILNNIGPSTGLRGITNTTSSHEMKLWLILVFCYLLDE